MFPKLTPEELQSVLLRCRTLAKKKRRLSWVALFERAWANAA